MSPRWIVPGVTMGLQILQRELWRCPRGLDQLSNTTHGTVTIVSVCVTFGPCPSKMMNL